MEKYYSLRELIKFFQRQYKADYEVVEAIVNLIEYKSENLPEEKKPQIILDTLRKHGLYEIGYEGTKTFAEDAPEISLTEEPDNPNGKVDWSSQEFFTQLEEYKIKILNGYVKFMRFMN